MQSAFATAFVYISRRTNRATSYSLRLLDLDVHLSWAQQEHARSDTLDGATHAENHARGKVHDAICHGLGHTGQVQHDRNAVANARPTS